VFIISYERGIEMAKLTPVQFREKHARRLKQSVEDIRQGVERVTSSPTVKAASKVAKMRANILAAIDSGKWEGRLKAVTLEEWKDKMKNIGINRIAAGIDGAAAKVENFAAQLLPYQDKLKSDIERMPDVTLEDNIGRMTSFIRGMAKFSKK